MGRVLGADEVAQLYLTHRTRFVRLAVLLAEEHREVLAALRQLPTRQREVLVLRYWADLSEAQIAETLGISPGTVKSTASRGLGALESLLDTEEVAR